MKNKPKKRQQAPTRLEWSWNDGWLLMALLRAQGTKGAPLFELIAAADLINHAIPNPEELSSALTKFLRCRLITAARSRYRLSPRHLRAIRKAYEGRGGLFCSGDKGLKWLKRAGLASKTHRRVDISRAQLSAAYDQYISLYWSEYWAANHPVAARGGSDQRKHESNPKKTTKNQADRRRLN